MNKPKRPPRRPRIEETDPERAADALAVVASTGSVRAASRATGLDRSTVKAILERNPEAFERCRPILARSFMELAEEALHVSHGKIEHLSASAAAVVAGIATDKATALLEKVPPHVQVNVNVGMLVERAQRLIAALRSPQPEQPAKEPTLSSEETPPDAATG